MTGASMEVTRRTGIIICITIVVVLNHVVASLLCGISRKLASAVMASIASPDGLNGHQEPIMYKFCEMVECKYLVIPEENIGVFQLGHWGRFSKPKSNSVFTSLGLTFGRNLFPNKLYHPLKCEADSVWITSYESDVIFGVDLGVTHAEA